METLTYQNESIDINLSRRWLYTSWPIRRLISTALYRTFMCGSLKVTLELLTNGEYRIKWVGVAGSLCKSTVWVWRTDEKQIWTVSFKALSWDSYKSNETWETFLNRTLLHQPRFCKKKLKSSLCWISSSAKRRRKCENMWSQADPETHPAYSEKRFDHFSVSPCPVLLSPVPLWPLAACSPGPWASDPSQSTGSSVRDVI